MHIRLVHKYPFTDHLHRLIATILYLHTEVYHSPMCATIYALPIRHNDA